MFAMEGFTGAEGGGDFTLIMGGWGSCDNWIQMNVFFMGIFIAEKLHVLALRPCPPCVCTVI